LIDGLDQELIAVNHDAVDTLAGDHSVQFTPGAEIEDESGKLETGHALNECLAEIRSGLIVIFSAQLHCAPVRRWNNCHGLSQQTYQYAVKQ
jgi:hypothetical protein